MNVTPAWSKTLCIECISESESEIALCSKRLTSCTGTDARRASFKMVQSKRARAPLHCIPVKGASKLGSVPTATVPGWLAPIALLTTCSRRGHGTGLDREPVLNNGVSADDSADNEDEGCDNCKGSRIHVFAHIVHSSDIWVEGVVRRTGVRRTTSAWTKALRRSIS